MSAEQFKEAIIRMLKRLNDRRKLSNIYHFVLHITGDAHEQSD